MDPYKILKIGEKYSKKDLSDLLDQDTLSIVREGLYHCKNSESTLFFVDLEKKQNNWWLGAIYLFIICLIIHYVYQLIILQKAFNSKFPI